MTTVLQYLRGGSRPINLTDEEMRIGQARIANELVASSTRGLSARSASTPVMGAPSVRDALLSPVMGTPVVRDAPLLASVMPAVVTDTPVLRPASPPSDEDEDEHKVADAPHGGNQHIPALVAADDVLAAHFMPLPVHANIGGDGGGGGAGVPAPDGGGGPPFPGGGGGDGGGGPPFPGGGGGGPPHPGGGESVPVRVGAAAAAMPAITPFVYAAPTTPILGMVFPGQIRGSPPKFDAQNTDKYVHYSGQLRSFLKANGSTLFLDHPPEVLIQMAIAEDQRNGIVRNPEVIRTHIDIHSGKVRGVLEQSLGNNAAVFINSIKYDPLIESYPLSLRINRDNDVYALVAAVEVTFIQSNAFEAGRAFSRLNKVTYRKASHPTVLMNDIMEIVNLLMATSAFAGMPTAAIEQLKVQAMLNAIRFELPLVFQMLSIQSIVTASQVYEAMINSWQSGHEPGLHNGRERERERKGGEDKPRNGIAYNDNDPPETSTKTKRWPDDSDKECHECGKKGHIARNCWQKHPELRPDNDKRRNKSSKKVNNVDRKKRDSSNDSNGDVVCMFTSSISSNHDGCHASTDDQGRIVPQRFVLAADTAACAHLTSYRSNLHDVQKLEESLTLHFANGSRYRVTEQGKMRVNSKLTLHGVLYVPGGDVNLVCMGKVLDNDKLKVTITHNKLTILKKLNNIDVVEFTRHRGTMHWEYKMESDDDNLNVRRQVNDPDSFAEYQAKIPKKVRFAAPPADENVVSPVSAPRGGAVVPPTGHFGKWAPFKSSVSMFKLTGQSRDEYVEDEQELFMVEDMSPFHKDIDNAMFAVSHPQPSLVHQRFAHPSVKKMKQLNDLYQLGLKPEVIAGDKEAHCQACVDGKMKATAIHSKWTHHNTMVPAKAKFDRLHADLIGPFTTTASDGAIVRNRTLGRNLYSLTVVDEYSGYRWSYAMRTKDETKGYINALFQLINTQFAVQVKEFHSDGGGEFITNDLAETCHNLGIKQTWTTANRPQHNGVAERHNGMALTSMRVFMAQAEAPATFYQEAISMAALTYNMTPRQYSERGEDGKKIVVISTPYYQVWDVLGPVDKIRVWGCDAFVLVPPHQRGKTDKLTMPGFYLCPSDQQNCHRIFIPSKMTIIHTRDVKFNERSFEQIQSCQISYKDLVREEKVVNNEWHIKEPTGARVERDENDYADSDELDSEGEQEEASEDEIEGPSLVDTPLSGVPTGAPPSLPPVIVVPNEPEDDGGAIIDVSDWDMDEEKYNSIDPVSDGDNEDEPHDITLLTSHDNDGAKGDAQSELAPELTRPRRNAPAPTRYTFPRRQRGKPRPAPVYAVSMIGNFEPHTYKQALKCEQAPAWRAAIKKEVDQVVLKKVFVPCRAPKGRRLLSSRWVFRLKIGADGQVSDHKARVVVRGFEQVAGVDYGDEITASVVRASSIRVLLVLAAKEDMELEQLDFKSAFLNAEMEEDVFILPPEGFEYLINDQHHNAFRLNKSLYGLKQAPLRWYETAVELFASLGYTVGVIDKCIFYKHVTITLDGKEERASIMLSLYVDDTLVVFNKLAQHIWDKDKAAIAATYDIKDMGAAKWILNMLITRDRDARIISLSQEVYVKSIVDKFGLTDSRTVPTPCIVDKLTQQEVKDDEVLNAAGIKYYQSMVGSIMYAAITTRIDISYAVNMLARHNAAPHNHHVTRAKRVLRYLNGTSSMQLVFGDKVSGAPVISAYSDADWAGDADRKSISGNILMLFGSPVCWQSKKQTVIAQSSCEAEYIAIAAMCNEVSWLQHWLHDVLGLEVFDVPLYTDSTAAIGVANNLGTHMRVKHIDVKVHLIREHTKNGTIKLVHLSTVDMPADLLTKPLAHEQFNKFTNQLLK